VDQSVEAPPDAGLDRPQVDIDRLALHLVGADLDQDQLGADRDAGPLSPVLLAEEPHIEPRLALVELAHRRRELRPAAHRLDLLDHQGALGVAPEAVEAAVDRHLEAAVVEGVAHHHLAAVGRIFVQRLLLVAAVDRLPEPHPLVAAAVGEAEAAHQPAVEEIGDGELEGQLVGVEAGRHGTRVSPR
jgi:hypothetical protein